MIKFKTFITEDMSGMSVSSGHKRSVAQGAGMTKKGVAAYRNCCYYCSKQTKAWK